MHKSNWMRILALASGCLCTLVAGLQLSLPIFLNAVKDTFHLYQIDVEILSGMFILGGGIVILPGIVFDRYGSIVCNLTGALFLCLGFSLILSSILNPSFYLHQAALLSIYFFLAGHGSAYLQLAAISVNILNFPEKDRGKVAMLLDVFYSCSPIVFSPLYYQIFSNGHYRQTSKIDLDGFIVFLLGLSLFTSLAAIFAMPYVGYDDDSSTENVSQANQESNYNLFAMQPVHKRKLKQEHLEENTPILPKQSFGDAADNYDENRRKCSNFKLDEEFSACITSQSYQLIMWTTALMGGICNVMLGNITAFSRSLDITSMDMYLSLGPALFGALVHIILGPASDLMIGMPGARGSVLFGTNVSLLLSLIFFLLAVPSVVGRTATTSLMIVFGLSQSGQAGLCFATIIYSECWPTQHLGKLIGFSQVIQNITGLILQTIFGLFYDVGAQNVTILIQANLQSTNSSLNKKKRHTCYGEQCFRWSIFVNFIVNIVALILNAWYLVKMKRKEKNCVQKDDEEKIKEK